MNAPDDKRRVTRIIIPRWVQLVLIPVAILLAFYFIRLMSDAVVIFLVSALVALLLDPIIAGLHRLKVPRVVAAPLVFIVFAAAVVLAFIFGGPPLFRQAENLVDRLPEFGQTIDGWILNLQNWLHGHNITINLQSEFSRLIDWLETQGLRSAGTIFNVGVSVAGFLFRFVLVIFISFYMLVSAKRIHAFLFKLVPGTAQERNDYLRGLQTSFTRFIRGQALLSFAVGIASGLGVWILGWNVVGVWPEGSQYALLFGAWAGITEVIPYLGPWLGALPPVLFALFTEPTAAIWVAVVYFAVQELEGHILVPNIMGASVGVHPLVVIFAVLAGAQIAGIFGMLAVLPILAMAKHTMDFYNFRFSRARWLGDDGLTAVNVERAPPPSEPGEGETPTEIHRPAATEEAPEPGPATEA